MFAIYFKGVWTLEEKGEKPTFNVTFESAEPTYTHRALVAMEIIGNISFYCIVHTLFKSVHHRPCTHL